MESTNCQNNFKTKSAQQRMRRRRIIVFIIVVVVASVMSIRFSTDRTKTKKETIATLSLVAVALEAEDKNVLLNRIGIPTSLRNKSDDEQYRFITAALDGEVSEEGLRILEKNGDFGPLMVIFPKEGLRWATITGVDPAACVAFKLECDGFTAEAAVVTNGTTKIIRLNNVRRLANETL